MTIVLAMMMMIIIIGSKIPVPECIVSVESMNIFPVGWCETNGYQLRPPRRAVGMNIIY